MKIVNTLCEGVIACFNQTYAASGVISGEIGRKTGRLQQGVGKEWKI